MTLRKRNLIVELTGGLGNQLFGLFFGLFYANDRQIPLILDDTKIPFGLTNHGSSIRSFNIDIPIVTSKYKMNRVINLKRKIIDKLYLEFKLFRKFYFFFFRIYKSMVAGFDPDINNLSGGFRAIGYFQSWKYVFVELDKLPNRTLVLKKQSDWLKLKSKEILERDPIVVHIRRGDFKVLGNPSGLLSKQYYLNALKNFSDFDQIWVFTDDIDDARKMFGDDYRFNFIEPPLNTDPAESMILMSLGSKIIIANSTFSWWAAAMGNPNKIVIAPAPFYKEMGEPQFFIPKKWRDQPSDWIT